MSNNPKLIAFYLTQFHPIPENDEWWEKGFTEWTNVTKALPLYKGHYQPHLPLEIGFYDLRMRESMYKQIKMAKQYGIDGFCYHYYWFGGKRLLEKPFNDMLADPKCDMPFCICWANENWTRRWDATGNDILIEQKYSEENDLNFIKDLIPVLKDPRYIKVNDAPIIIVYRPQQMLNPNKAIQKWREFAKSVGIEKLHLCAALTHGNNEYQKYGFDSGVEFPPHNIDGVRVFNKEIDFFSKFWGHIFPFEVIANAFLERRYENQNVYKTVFPSWDNTARRNKHALIVPNGTPGNYEFWLTKSIELTKKNNNKGDSLVFINAWNEWAEGCHLEPDRKFGYGFLDATLRAKKNSSTLVDFPDKAVFESEKRKFSTELIELVTYHFSIGFRNLRYWISKKYILKLLLKKPYLLAKKLFN